MNLVETPISYNDNAFSVKYLDQRLLQRQPGLMPLVLSKVPREPHYLTAEYLNRIQAMVLYQV